MAALLSDSSDEEDINIKVNTDYAKKYDSWRAKEEQQKLKDRYGNDTELLHSSSESSSESEDELDLQNVVDKQFLTTLSLLKSKDPSIYEKDVVFFPQEDPTETEEPIKNKTKSKKPMFLRDYEREMLLKNEGQIPEEKKMIVEENLDDGLKESFRKFLQDSDSEDESLLTEKQKTQAEQTAEEENYIQWLKGKASDENEVTEMKGLKDFWSHSHLESGEAFLRDYILEKRYLHNEDNETQLAETLSEDEKELEQQEMFEHKYNFRFEEPDPEFIQRYPRTMKESMRKKDDRRKKKRDEQRLRKQQEKDRKREEIKRLKALKRKEITEKLERLKEITGNTQMGFSHGDLEADFNPDEYDQRMNQLFNDEYYADADAEKPECNDECLGEYNKEEDEMHCEDPGFNMDAEYNPQEAKATSSSVSHFKNALSRKKPIFDPNEKSFEKYFDEYYGLDFEDIVGGMPVRFRYREVLPNDFGLTTDEILSAQEKELNRWCSLKKASQYRSESEEKYDVQAFQKKAENHGLKKKILTSIYGDSQDAESEGSTNSKRKRSKQQPETEVNLGVSDERLKAYGLNPKKYKNKLKYKSKT